MLHRVGLLGGVSLGIFGVVVDSWIRSHPQEWSAIKGRPLTEGRGGVNDVPVPLKWDGLSRVHYSHLQNAVLLGDRKYIKRIWSSDQHMDAYRCVRIQLGDYAATIHKTNWKRRLPLLFTIYTLRV
jgi:hypothetical protein